MPNIYLFYGDQFFTEQKVNKRKKEFTGKYGQENIFYFSSTTLDTKELISSIRGGSLFSNKKLVVIDNIPNNTTTKLNEGQKEQINNFYDYFIANYQHIDQDTLVVFSTSNPDKKTKRAKWFLDGDHQDIKISEQKSDKKSIQEYVETRMQQAKCKLANYDLLLELCNNNMYFVANEITKIIAYGELHPGITLGEKDLEKIIATHSEYDVRSFLDGIILHQDNKSIDKLIVFSHDDNNEFQFLGLMYGSVGGMINLIDCREHNINSPGDLAKYSKLPPFTVSRYASKKDLLLTKKRYFINLFQSLVDLDFKLKTGQLPIESFWISIINELAQSTT